MPIVNLQPQTPTTPDQGGTIAVTGMSTTGHSSTLTGVSVVAVAPFGSSFDSQAKSARWSNFQPGPSVNIKSKRLKFNYNVSVNTSANPPVDGSADSGASFSIQYSLDGGANWINVAANSVGSNQSTGASGPADILLSPTQNVGLVMVRNRADVSASAGSGEFASSSAGANVTMTIDSIRLEVQTLNAHPPIFIY